jgi:hypothetical protein
LVTVATEAEAEDEVHFTAPVTFCVGPSANVPVAVSCSNVCSAMLPLLGSVIFRLTSGDEVTSRVFDPLTLPRVALIVVVPGPPPVANPEALTPATDGELELQVAVKVTACEVPSLNCPVAVYCTPVAGAITEFCGAASMLNNSAIAWNVLEGLVAVIAGAMAGSISLVGFGLDSFIEVISGAHFCGASRLMPTCSKRAK